MSCVSAIKLPAARWVLSLQRLMAEWFVGQGRFPVQRSMFIYLASYDCCHDRTVPKRATMCSTLNAAARLGTNIQSAR